MKVLICGDRHWNNYQSVLDIVKRIIKKYDNVIIIEGGCSGADAMAKKAAIECNIPYKEYPAHWDKHGKAAGPIRNQKMLDEEKPDMVIAFHSEIDKSKGTKDMQKRVKKASVPFFIIKH